jgi:3-hydroxybutyryl-CoA dehydrogenase
MKKVGVLGLGSMGRGIAQVAAMAGHEVLVFDQNDKQVEEAKQFLQSIFNKLATKGKITTEAAQAAFGRLYFLSTPGGFAETDILIEAIIEDIDIKKRVFTELEGIIAPDAILATNTSSISVSAIAGALQNQERFLGLHFFNPAALMKLVEVVPALQTDKSHVQDCKDLMIAWGKIPVQAKDTPGFIVNRIARPFYGEALRIYDEGLADFVTIDHAMKEIGGFRMGPFELMDFIGNDVNYTVTETVFQSFFNDPRYKPSFTQKRLSDAGWLGRKTGRGYYNYGEGALQPQPEAKPDKLHSIFDRILVMLINEAADALFWQIADKKDIELAMTKGVNYPKGLLAWADEVGMHKVRDQMDELYDIYREDRYRCSPLIRTMAKNKQTFF